MTPDITTASLSLTGVVSHERRSAECQSCTEEDFTNRKRRKHLEALAHIARTLKAERETGPMRKVLVLLFGLDRVLLCGDLVLEVPSEMTDEEVSTKITLTICLCPSSGSVLIEGTSRCHRTYSPIPSSER